MTVRHVKLLYRLRRNDNMKPILNVFSFFMLYACFSCVQQGSVIHEKIEAVAVRKGIDLYNWVGNVDSLLVGYVYYDSPMFKTFVDEADMIYETNRLVRKGRGPMEFQSPFFCIDENNLYIIECGRGTLNKVAKYSIPQKTDGVAEDIFMLNCCHEFSNVLSITSLDSLRLICLTNDFASEDILFLMDFSIDSIRKISFPISDSFLGEPSIKAMVYTSNAKIHYNKKLAKLAYACGEGQYLEIMDYKDGNVCNRKKVLSILPEYSIWSEGNLMSYEMIDKRHRGVQSWMTEQGIYISYNNWDYDSLYKEYPWYYTDIIYVFDWEGNKIRSFMTDRPFSTFMVSADDKKLYTISMELETSEPLICSYYLE